MLSCDIAGASARVFTCAKAVKKQTIQVKHHEVQRYPQCLGQVCLKPSVLPAVATQIILWRVRNVKLLYSSLSTDLLV
jgi:hypothetical protein